MMSTVTTRGQTAIPAAIRRRYNLLSRSRIEWIDDGHSIAVVPVAEDAIGSLRGKYKRYMLGEALTKSRVEERNRG
jgi:bifunctional DNA-binding transcriptional regulator/antitoxin component of YhaV-PrlF toxin-antitoxin module